MRLEGFEPPTNGLEDPPGLPVGCCRFGFLPAQHEGFVAFRGFWLSWIPVASVATSLPLELVEPVRALADLRRPGVGSIPGTRAASLHRACAVGGSAGRSRTSQEPTGSDVTRVYERGSRRAHRPADRRLGHLAR